MQYLIKETNRGLSFSRSLLSFSRSPIGQRGRWDRSHGVADGRTKVIVVPRFLLCSCRRGDIYRSVVWNIWGYGQLGSDSDHGSVHLFGILSKREIRSCEITARKLNFQFSRGRKISREISKQRDGEEASWMGTLARTKFSSDKWQAQGVQGFFCLKLKGVQFWGHWRIAY